MAAAATATPGRKPALEEAVNYGMDKLSSEIFSLLESKFLFGTPASTTPDPSSSPAPPFLRSPARYSSSGKVRVLSVDAAGATEGLLAAASLARLETVLRLRTGEPSARIADFFDVAAGSGVGGVLVALLFSGGPNNRPLMSAPEALRFLSKYHGVITGTAKKRGGFFRSLFKSRSGSGGSSSSSSSSAKVFKSVFGDLTLRDTLKPVLIPCYDLTTGAPFVFSRADAVEMDGAYDFRMWEVCAATMGMAAAAKVVSLDGRTVVSAAALDGGVAMGNPAAAAVTHVLNNKMEFPMARGVQDLVLVSLGNGEACGNGSGSGWRSRGGSATPGPARIARIAGDGVSDMIDQAVAMSFGSNRAFNYIRIQGRDSNPRPSPDAAELLSTAEEMLMQRNVESVLFRGKKLSDQTNADRLEWAAGELVKESERRKRSPVPVVAVSKPGGRRCSTSSCSSSLVSSSTSPSSLTSSP